MADKPIQDRGLKRRLVYLVVTLYYVGVWYMVNKQGNPTPVLDLAERHNIARTLHSVISLVGIRWLPVLSLMGIIVQQYDIGKLYLVFHMVITLNVLVNIGMLKGVM